MGVVSYEKTGGSVMGLVGSGVAVASAAGTTTLLATTIHVPPPSPELAYHLQLASYEVFPLGLLVGIGVGALYVTLRAVPWKDLIRYSES